VVPRLVTLYVQGKPAATAAISGELVASDPELSGALAELRVYDRALTLEELETSHHAGPDPAFLE
jgi:hypothetical protein